MNDGINMIAGLSDAAKQIPGKTDSRIPLQAAFSRHRVQNQQGKKDNFVGTVWR